MRGSLRAVAGIGVLVLATSRLIAACGGDDDAAPPDPFTNDADLPERNLGPDPDAQPDEDGSVVVIDPPSFCNGIVFYASLDIERVLAENRGVMSKRSRRRTEAALAKARTRAKGIRSNAAAKTRRSS